MNVGKASNSLSFFVQRRFMSLSMWDHVLYPRASSIGSHGFGRSVPGGDFQVDYPFVWTSSSHCGAGGSLRGLLQFLRLSSWRRGWYGLQKGRETRAGIPYDPDVLSSHRGAKVVTPNKDHSWIHAASK